MFVVFIFVLIVMFFYMGGVSEIVIEICFVDLDMFNMFKGISVFGIIFLFVWGLGYFG